tara:strand:+ start:10088 stop:11032 length:945 start_codon:yes stop_codon:yes gene_type:complete
MKLIIQIPCFNEEDSLPATICDLPEKVEGFDTVEYLVIDDGSTDKTYERAKKLGVHHVIQLGSNRGLATAFKCGIEFALENGADVVVNTDGDNQYCADDIPKLTKPIIEKKADMVIGCRPIKDHPEFIFIKKILQWIGSWALRKVSRTNVRDAASGFRAFSRETCQRMSIVTQFSYTMESLIQAGNSGLRLASVDIRVNKKTRDSRLFKSIPEFIYRSGSTILMMFLLYRPGRFFSICSSFFLGPALILGLRFLYLVYINPDPTRTYIPSLILLSIFAWTGFLLIALGLIGVKIKALRQIQHEILYITRKNRKD